MRVLIYILVAVLAVGCAAEMPGDHNTPNPNPDKPNKIVIPINPRPKYPGGIIKEPRIIDNNFTFEIYRPSRSAAYSVTVRSVATGEEYHTELSAEQGSVIVPCKDMRDEYEVTLLSEDGTVVESATFSVVDANL